MNEIDTTNLKKWLESTLSPKWSDRDINILYDTLQVEFQKYQKSGKPVRTDREYFTKMLIKGKLQKGIAPDQ
jgi:hypothetical protein